MAARSDPGAGDAPLRRDADVVDTRPREGAGEGETVAAASFAKGVVVGSPVGLKQGTVHRQVEVADNDAGTGRGRDPGGGARGLAGTPRGILFQRRAGGRQVAPLDQVP